jgi:NTP pyrophosphatase (non-canonical NTP hydrolase)
MSNFTQVCDLNKAFGRPKTNSQEQDYTKLENQFSLVLEEVEELQQAIKDENWTEVKDAIGDILVVTYGMGYVADINCDRLMANISESNFSKFCTPLEKTQTVDYYEGLGAEVVAEETMINGMLRYAIKSAKDQTYTEKGVEKAVKKGKLLKNVNWEEPELDVEN